MQMSRLSRRAALLGAASLLGGCGAVSALNSAARPMDTFDLLPVPATDRGAARRGAVLVVAMPDAPASLATDRILVKPDRAAITYLPDARWSDDLPSVIQSLLIRSISGAGRLGYVGRTEGGPVPDTALLVRLDTFGVDVQPDGAFDVSVDMSLTLLRDRDQRVIASRSFAAVAPAADDSADTVVATFQNLLNILLPEMAEWAIRRA